MKNLNLEISLKPFFALDEAGIRSICDHALAQWEPLVREAQSVSVMFWTGDGSELLDYDGKLETKFEWARFLGNANAFLHPTIPSDPEGKSLHAKCYLFREDATTLLTYGRLKTIVRIWREAITAKGKHARIGTTFDAGGEFAPSTFKYQRHREICLADTMGKASFVCCYGVLNADDRPYAGFPAGIHQGTTLGTFLGRQFHHFATDLGFDFLWLSNGFGFGMETWATIGPLFDGKTFKPELAPETRDKIVGFWRDFRRECPGFDLMTRGTNLGTGTDLASDATPLRELYEGGFGFEPPPNSPWAALNGDFGIELAGYMSRITELPPGRGALFRFYIHDPWWLNSPWLDRYERQPHDIYLPLAVSRVDHDGITEPPENLSILTLDDSYGRMPDVVPREVNVHLTRAWEERADAPGPLVWLYPFDELHDAMFGATPAPDRLFHNDWFVRETLNDGLPLNTTVSTRAWRALGHRVNQVFGGRIIVTPAPFDSAGEDLLLAWADTGGRLLVYGPLDRAPRLRQRLGLAPAAPLEGEMRVASRLASVDAMTRTPADRYLHQNIMSGGALTEITTDGTEPLVSAITESGERRALAATAGTIDWLRGPLPMRLVKHDHLPVRDNPSDTYPLATLARCLLSRTGWHIGLTARDYTQRRPVLTIHRQTNGWFFSGYMPDTTVEIALKSPFGSPLLLGLETWLRDGSSTYRLQRGWRHECRVFVEQADGWLKYIEELPGQVGVTRRSWVHGLKDATVRFWAPTGSGPVTFFTNPLWPFVSGDTIPLREVITPHGLMLETTQPVTGTLLISW